MIRQLIHCLGVFSIAFLLGGVAAADDDDGSSPSDLEHSPVEVRIQVSTGREFRGTLLAPSQLSIAVEGGLLTLSAEGLGEIQLTGSAGAATVTLRDGSQLSGRLVDAKVTMGMGYGRLHFVRSKLRRIAALDTPPVARRTTVRRAAFRPVAVTPVVRSLPVRQPAPQPPAIDVQPAPGLGASSLTTPPAPTVLYTRPDVFSGYAGVPTWHPRPVILRQPQSNWSRVYSGR